MDKRTAKKRAHDIAYQILQQARASVADGWSDDQREHELLDEAIQELAEAHRVRGLDEHSKEA